MTDNTMTTDEQDQKRWIALYEEGLMHASLTRKEYNKAYKWMRKSGKHMIRDRGKCVFIKGITHEERLRRQRVYMKEWRMTHPRYEKQKECSRRYYHKKKLINMN